MPKVLPDYKVIARSRILETARAMFKEKGFRQTTMDEIARELGISKAALYTYFDDKEELFKAAYASSPRELEKMIEWVMSKGDAKDAFMAFFDQMMPGSEKGASLDFEVISEAMRNSDLRKALKSEFDGYLQAVQKCIEVTSKQKRHDSKELARAILALWHGMEALLILGYPIEETREYWKVAMGKLLS